MAKQTITETVTNSASTGATSLNGAAPLATNTTESVVRTYKTVNGKEASADLPKGDLSFVRASQLAKDGITGIVAQGIYEGTVPNRFDAAKPDFKVRGDAGNLIILNNAGSLASQLARVALGSYVQINYKGMQAMTTGKMAGKKAHSFIVLIAD